MELSRIGLELQEKRESKEMATIWSQLWTLMLSVLIYTAFSSLWGQKVIYLVTAIAISIIIYILNRI